MEARQRATASTERWSYLWLALGAVFVALSSGQWSLALAGWLAPVFLIRFFRSRRVLAGYVFVLLGLYVGYAVGWRSALAFDVFRQWIPYLVLALLMALNGSLALLADRLLAPRLPGFAATLAFPLATVASWYVYNLFSPLGSFGTVGYEQSTNQALTQVVSITGMWGLVFLVSWLGPVVNWAWERSFDWSKIRRGLLVFGCVIGVVLLFGALRLSFLHPEAGTARMHAISLSAEEKVRVQVPGFSETNEKSYRAGGQKLSDAFLEATVREARAGAQIVLWPEQATGGTQGDVDVLVARAGQIARQENIYVAMGVQVRFFDSDRKTENRLIMVDPSGKVVLNHLKYGAAILDGIAQGNGELQTVETPYGTLTGIICWDADFPTIVKQAGQKGADILLVANAEPAVPVADLHAHQAVFRSVENGVSLFRTDAGKGWSISTDPYGRVIGAVDSLRATDRVMIAQVPTHRTFTLYPVIGDLVAWLSIAGFLGIIAWAIVRARGRRAANEPGPSL